MSGSVDFLKVLSTIVSNGFFSHGGWNFAGMVTMLKMPAPVSVLAALMVQDVFSYWKS